MEGGQGFQRKVPADGREFLGLLGGREGGREGGGEGRRRLWGCHTAKKEGPREKTIKG
jgi:hypothetical protein